MWENTEIQPISRKATLALFENRIPAVRIESFASRSEIDQLSSALLEYASRTNSIQEVTRLGISQYEQGIRGSKDSYFKMVSQLDAEFSKIYAQSFSPLQRMVNILEKLGFDAGIMTEPGMGQYFAGSGKLRNGYSPIHVDFSPQDSSGWSVAQVQAQLAWNVYLNIPRQGGQLLIWDKQWNPEDDEFQVDGSYYYSDTVVSSAQLLPVQVHPGEVIIINSRNYHAVEEANDRLAYGSFIGVLDDYRLRFWS